MNNNRYDSDADYRLLVGYLRRLWWIPLLFAVVAASAVYVLSGSGYIARSTLGKGAPSPELVSAGFPGDLLAAQPPFESTNISSERLLAEAQAIAGDEISASVTRSVNAESLEVFIRGSERTSVETALEFYVAEFSRLRVQDFQRSVDNSITEVQNGLDLSNERIVEIDRQLASVADPSSSLANALLADRSEISDEIAGLDRQRAALVMVREDPSAAVTVLNHNGGQAVDTGAAVTSILAAGTFGALVGLTLVYLLAVRARRTVHSGAELAAATQVPVFSVVSVGVPDTEFRRTVALVTGVLGRNEVRPVQLLPLGASAATPDVSRLAAKLVAAGFDVSVGASLESDPSAILFDGSLLLVGLYARTTRAEAQRAAQELAHVGARVIGAVLFGAPQRETDALTRADIGSTR